MLFLSHFLWFRLSLKAQIWMEWGGVSCSRRSSARLLSADPRNYSGALWEHGGGLWTDPQLTSPACGWVWGGRVRAGGRLRQAAQTTGLVTLPKVACGNLSEKPKWWPDTPHSSLLDDQVTSWECKLTDIWLEKWQDTWSVLCLLLFSKENHLGGVEAGGGLSHYSRTASSGTS